MTLERFAGSPKQLAALRIVVVALILVSPELHRAAALAAAPGALVSVPEGLGVVARLGLGYTAVRVLQILALSAGATALLGWQTRPSLAILTVAGGVCFSFSSREGAVLHDMHLFWLSALLATSPCGDAYALDAYKRSAPAPSIRYGLPLAFARLFLGLVYFFPGLHKLLAGGLAWTSATNVTNHLHSKWMQHGVVPAFRLDHHPTLCTLGAVAAIAFELSFVLLALHSRRSRLVALVMGLGFHLVTDRVFLIPFPSLWLCYVVLLDPRPQPPAEAPLPRATIAVGALITLAAIVQGARAKTEAWPFACYPTFATLPPNTMVDLVVEADLADGSTRRLVGRAGRTQAEWGRVYRIAGAYGDPPNVPALRQHAQRVLGDTPDVERYRVYRVQAPTAPERWDEVPAGGVLLMAEATPGPAP